MKVVRCNTNNPSPYLLKCMEKYDLKAPMLDVGCGNGRNLLLSSSFGLDIAPPPGHIQFILKEGNALPFKNNSFNTILLNYVLMFIPWHNVLFTLQEVKRLAKRDCIIICELYDAKNSFNHNLNNIIEELNVDVLHQIKDRFCGRI